MAGFSPNDQAFQYSPLETDDTIRVVIVLPGDEGEETEYMIQHITPEKPVPYIALSYVWGDPTNKESICLDGHLFPVTQNLNAFLQTIPCGYEHYETLMGSDDELLAFWIDAICINQQDDAERSQQVQRMKQIYERSASVIAWLGVEDAHSDIAFSKMLRLRSYYDARAAVLGHRGVNIAVLESISRANEEIFGSLDGPLDLAPWKALHEFFERDWWRRTWIVQESTTDVITNFACGRYIISRVTMDVTVIIFLGIVRVPELVALEKITGIEVPLRLYNFRHQRRGGGPTMHLLPVLEFLRNHEATDLRDKVYAGLGLAIDYVPGEMRVDYSLSVAEVYVELVRYLLKKSQNLDCLGLVSRSAHQMPGLPSWAPDLSCFVGRKSFPKYLERENGILGPVYNASGSASTLRGCSTAFIERNKLLLQGIYVDKISSLGQPAGKSLRDTSVEKTWVPADQQRTYQHTGETMLTAYFRTVVTDVVMEDAGPIARASHIKWPLDLRSSDDLLSITSTGPHTSGTPMSMIKSATAFRRFATTKCGYIGLVPSYAEVEDEIWVLLGGQVLYVLREAERKYILFGEKGYEFIGECYMHGLMDGEAMQPLNEGRAQPQTVVLK